MSTIKLINIGEIVTYNSRTKTLDYIVDSDILINDGCWFEKTKDTYKYRVD